MGYHRSVLRVLVTIGLCVAACGPRSHSSTGAAEEGDPLGGPALMRDVGVLVSDEMKGRGSYQPGGQLAADYVASEFAKAGLDVYRQRIRVDSENIIGIKRGGPRAVIISAHHDHLGIDTAGKVYPGADDNASGTAVLLAIARSRAAADYDHSVLFISFGAEEDGLVGSGHYVHHPLWPLDRTVAVINFDMVGRNLFEAGIDQPSAVAVVGLEDNKRLASAARRAADTSGIKLVPAPARLLELFALHDRTDDWWFRRQRIPAIHFSTGLHDDYHEPTDTSEKLVPAQMSKIARTAAGLLDETASRTD